MKTKVSLCAATIALAGGIILSSAIQAASNEQENSTPQQVFDGMKESFKADKAKGVHLKWQWELSGPNGGKFLIEGNDGAYKKGKGKIDNPKVTFITRDNDWGAMWNGKLKSTWGLIT